MKKATQANVTKALKAKGFPIELVQGKGYCYFIYDDGDKFETQSEFVDRVSDMDYDKWLEAGEAFAAKLIK